MQITDYETFAVVLNITMLFMSVYSGVRDTGSACPDGIECIRCSD